MDPVTAFGVAAGALQFLQCTLDTTKSTYLTMKDAKRDMLDLMISSRALSAIFEVLGSKDPHSERWQLEYPSPIFRAVEMQDLFSSLGKELNALGTQLSGLEPLHDQHQLRTKLRSFLPRLKWAFRAGEVERIVKQINGYQDLLRFAIETETLSVFDLLLDERSLTASSANSRTKLCWLSRISRKDISTSSTCSLI
jgi:hypothetical protein